MPLSKPETRYDPIHDRFVIIAPKRGARPNDVERRETASPKRESSKDCPFCNEPLTVENTLLAMCGRKHWCVRVVQNKFPAVTLDNPKAYGTQEVVIETPEHDVELADLNFEHILHIFRAYQDRTQNLMKNKRIKYILIFKNQGGKAGASLRHAHSQIMATSFIPPHIIQRLVRSEEWQVKHGACYHCDLSAKERKGPRLISSDSCTVAFAPYASLHGYEAWIMPRRHVDNITRMTPDEIKSFVKITVGVLKKINRLGLAYNFYLHQVTTERNEHFYLRIAPRGSIWGGVELGSRMVINSIAPEDAAKYFRKK